MKLSLSRTWLKHAGTQEQDIPNVRQVFVLRLFSNQEGSECTGPGEIHLTQVENPRTMTVRDAST